MGKLELQQMVLGPVYTNCYFLKNKETGETLIVDPADSPKRIFQKVEDMGAKPVGILLTHGHFDHIMAVQAVKAEYHSGLCLPPGRRNASGAFCEYD